jgi:DNA-binding transcriptional ArsR family regulator
VAPKEKLMRPYPPLAQTRSDFIERTGLISQAEGLPRIAGRVFGMLIFDGEAICFGDLATRLKVSRASVSTSVRLLEERGLIRRLTKPGARQDFFQLAHDPYTTLLEGVRKRTRSSRAQIDLTIDNLAPGAGAADRLAAYADFYAALETAVEMALENLGKSAQPAHVGQSAQTARPDKSAQTARPDKSAQTARPDKSAQTARQTPLGKDTTDER